MSWASRRHSVSPRYGRRRAERQEERNRHRSERPADRRLARQSARRQRLHQGSGVRELGSSLHDGEGAHCEIDGLLHGAELEQAQLLSLPKLPSKWEFLQSVL